MSDPGSNYLKRNCFFYKDARVHYVVLKQQPHHTHPPHHTHHNKGCVLPAKENVMPRKTRNKQQKNLLLPQDPTVCQTPPTTTKHPFIALSPQPHVAVVLKLERFVPTGTYFIDIPPLSNSPRNMRSGSKSLLLTPPKQPMRAIP